jgi:hypothetical protein
MAASAAFIASKLHVAPLSLVLFFLLSFLFFFSRGNAAAAAAEAMTKKRGMKYYGWIRRAWLITASLWILF